LELGLTAALPIVTVGLLFSTTGAYAALGREGLAGAQLAIAALNASGTLPFRIRDEHRDPHGMTERYAGMAAEIVALGARHIVGCTTSWSRKEVIPVLEKHDATLWYPCPYEGFECNEQVVYLGACPNQHILPLLQHILPRFGSNGYLVGSNYIWGWETNRIARDIIEQSGGSIAGERYAPLGDADLGHILRDIRLKRPDFVLNTLIGPSSYSFLEAYHALGEADPDFSMEKRPVVSCNLAEGEAALLGHKAAGLYTIAPYFQALPTSANQHFLSQLDAASQPVSAFFAQAYSAVQLLVAGLVAAETEDGKSVLASLSQATPSTPLGPLQILAANNHAVLTPHIARVTASGALAIIEQRDEPIAPDPYLAHTSLVVASADRARAGSNLRVVK
jgi:branched-chain amino acid transport system substrate-binding protein